MQPTPGDVHVNVPLTQISIAYLQEQGGFIADQVFPNIPVQKQSDRYYTYDRGNFNRDQMKERAPATESKGIEYTLDNTPSYFCPNYALHHDIPDDVRANADSVLSPDREATELVTMQALIRREKLWMANFFVPSVWTGGDVDGVAGVPGAGEFKQWNDAASTPIEDMRAAKTTVKEGTGFMPNTLVLSQRVWDKLADHPDIVDRVKYGQTSGGPARVTREAVAALLELDRIIVASAIENSAKEGAANVHAFIGGKRALLCYAAPRPGLMTPSAGYTFSWVARVASGPQGQRISRFRMEHLKADRVEIEMAYVPKMIGADLGYFFDAAVA